MTIQHSVVLPCYRGPDRWVNTVSGDGVLLGKSADCVVHFETTTPSDALATLSVHGKTYTQMKAQTLAGQVFGPDRESSSVTLQPKVESVRLSHLTGKTIWDGFLRVPVRLSGVCKLHAGLADVVFQSTGTHSATLTGFIKDSKHLNLYHSGIAGELVWDAEGNILGLTLRYYGHTFRS